MFTHQDILHKHNSVICSHIACITMALTWNSGKGYGLVRPQGTSCLESPLTPINIPIHTCTLEGRSKFCVPLLLLLSICLLICYRLKVSNGLLVQLCTKVSYLHANCKYNLFYCISVVHIIVNDWHTWNMFILVLQLLYFTLS